MMSTWKDFLKKKNKRHFVNFVRNYFIKKFVQHITKGTLSNQIYIKPTKNDYYFPKERTITDS